MKHERNIKRLSRPISWEGLMVILAIALFFLLFWATVFADGCVTQTIYTSDGVTVCTTCCYSGYCTTTCT